MNIRLVSQIVLSISVSLILTSCMTTPSAPSYQSPPRYVQPGQYAPQNPNNNPYSNQYPPQQQVQPTYCGDCGIVVRIDTVASQRPNSPTGAVLGGVVGAIVGHEISDKTGGSKGNQNVSAALGATAGALAGNAIQNNTGPANYVVHVQMEDGRVLSINQRDLAGVRENTYVRVVNGRVIIR